MNKILCSTGTITGRANGRNIALLDQCIPTLKCDGYELMLYEDWYTKLSQIETYITSLHLSFPVLHADKFIGQLVSSNEISDNERALERFEINCAFARKIGAQTVVLHLWNGVVSDSNISKNMDAYRHLRAISDSYNLTLAVENVVCNCHDPMTHLKALAMRYDDIHFTFDTKMAAFHSQLEEIYKFENRPIFEKVSHIHINDYAGGYMDWSNLRTLHIGKGNIDFQRFFDFIGSSSYRGYLTLECTSFDSEGKLHLDELNKSIENVRSYLNNCCH